MATRIEIATDFSDVPAGRYPDDGPFNGQLFRQKHLVPALRSSPPVTVAFDDTEGFGSSFLEEAFGGLVRKEGFSSAQLSEILILEAHTARAMRFVRKAAKYISDASKRPVADG